MRVDDGLAAAVADAERRGLGELKPMLETLARSLTALRAADDEHRAGERQVDDGKPPDGPAVP
jgi:hypothetical protein